MLVASTPASVLSCFQPVTPGGYTFHLHDLNHPFKKRDFDRIVEITDDLAPELKKLALDIHGNPEMGRKGVSGLQVADGTA